MYMIFDIDICGKFINILLEPHPYATLFSFERICMSVYIPNEQITYKANKKVNEYVVDIILAIFCNGVSKLQTLSVLFYTVIGSFVVAKDWSLPLSGPTQIPRIMTHENVEYVFLINR